MADEQNQESAHVPYGLEQARADVIEAIATSGLQHSDANPEERDGLAKVGDAGFSFELRFNGQTIALEGQDVTVVPGDAFQDFLETQRLAAENGDLDTQISQALAQDGPMKALARVRAVDSAQG